MKRPHDYEAYLSPDAGVEVKRSRPTHCSPFRPQLGTLAATLPHTSSPTYQSASNDKSPFAQVRGSAQLSDNQLEDYLRTEIKYLKRRKLIPKRLGESSSALNNDSSSNYRRGGSSPSSSHVSNLYLNINLVCRVEVTVKENNNALEEPQKI